MNDTPERKVIIKAEKVTKIFGNRPEEALELLDDGVGKEDILKKTGQTIGVADVSFEAYQGETLVFMGLSGSGKSTLVRCVNRLIEPTRGEILVEDQDVKALDHDELLEFRRKKFGMVFQHFALFPHRTVIQNAAYGLEIQGMEKTEREKKAGEALELVGLSGYSNQKPGQLSGGMQQRVGLARALAIDPDILLMDEAFSALDPLIRGDMQQELVSLQERVQKTILFITHDLDEALNVGDRIVLMKGGRVVQTGTAEEILTNPATDYVAQFVENVDKSKVLTASRVMKKAAAVAYPSDGPRTALHKMKEAGIDFIFAVSKNREMVGVIGADDAAEAANKKEAKLDDIIMKDVPTVGPDDALADILPVVADAATPVAVVDENKKLLGVVIKGSLLAGLVEGGSKE